MIRSVAEYVDLFVIHRALLPMKLRLNTTSLKNIILIAKEQLLKIFERIFNALKECLQLKINIYQEILSLILAAAMASSFPHLKKMDFNAIWRIIRTTSYQELKKLQAVWMT